MWKTNVLAAEDVLLQLQHKQVPVNRWTAREQLFIRHLDSEKHEFKQQRSEMTEHSK